MNDIRHAVKTVFLSQLVITAVVAGGAWQTGGTEFAVAALYGGGCAIAMMMLLGLKIRNLEQNAERKEINNGVLLLAVGFVPRFLLVLAAFAVGIGALGLRPEPLLISYAIVHLAYLLILRPSSQSANR